jgi:Flp pilus assembly pilin Flp
VCTKPNSREPRASRRTLKGMNMRTILARMWNEEAGQDLTEYALLLVMIALASMAALTPLASAINSVFSNAAVNLNAST